jgi:AAA domain
MTAREILRLLKRVRRNGTRWTALCPAHPDSNPSLSISESDGRVLLHCHAGCTPETVVATLGLKMADLFIHSRDITPNIVATYDYVDESGKLLFQVVRRDPKGFSQRRPDGRGGWHWNLDGARRVLYRLPSLIGSDLVLICEGEKDCESAREMGLVATCNPGGAGKWRPQYSESLRGKHIVIVPDRDEPGIKHGFEVARSVIELAASVKMIDLPTGKDLSDWADGVRSGAREKLGALIDATHSLTSEGTAQWPTESPPEPGRGFRFTSLGELMHEPDELVAWLVEGLLPAGGLSLVAAKPKVGKSTLARCLALSVARGEPFLGRTVAQGPVIYLALEEKREEVKKHFGDLGARGIEPIVIHCAAAPQDALTALQEEIKRRRPALVIIDPILRMTRLKDANDYAQVSNALEPLMSLARENTAHLLMVYHLVKGERAEASDAILGSTAFFAAVDSAIILKRLEQHRTVQSRQRYGTDLPETVLNFDPDRRSVSLGVERTQAETERVSDAILEFLRTVQEPKTEQEIDEEVEGRNAAKRSALRQLVTAQRIIRQGSGRRGSPYTYEFADSCPPDMSGTTVQETGEGHGTRINRGENLVPDPNQERRA